MKQSEIQTREIEFRIESLQYLEFLYHEMEKRRNTLHSDISRTIECASVEKFFPNLSLISSVSDSLENKILSKDEIKDVKHLLTIMSVDLKKSGHEHLELEMLLTRWIIFHEEILSPEQ